MKKQYLLLVALVFTCLFSNAQVLDTSEEYQAPYQEEEAEEADDDNHSAINFSGSADVYFRSNFNGDTDAAPGTSFANLPGFSLGMANIVATHDGERAGVTADLVFGPRGEDATFLSGTLRPINLEDGVSNNSSIINQLSAYYNISDNVTATIGNFNTFLGYEVIQPTANFNYSTSYMFSYGPFSHTGLKVDIAATDELSFMGGVFNLTDETEFNFSDDYAYGAQVGYAKGIASIYVNGLFADGYTQGDITAGFDVAENTYFGLNATSVKDSFAGIAGYLQQSFSDTFAVGTRVEYFKDDGLGILTLEEDPAVVDEDVLDITFSGNVGLGNLTLIPEIRFDTFSEAIISDGSAREDNLGSFLVAAVYGF